jgi:DNA-binding response OmpR family regulator
MQQGPLVLVVDDEAFIRDVVTLVLRKGGFHVLAAATGEEALHLMRESPAPIYLAVLDLMMPDLGGARLFDRLCELQPGVRALYISGYSTALGLPEGSMVLHKPFTATELLRAVDAGGSRTMAQRA